MNSHASHAPAPGVILQPAFRRLVLPAARRILAGPDHERRNDRHVVHAWAGTATGDANGTDAAAVAAARVVIEASETGEGR